MVIKMTTIYELSNYNECVATAARIDEIERAIGSLDDVDEIVLPDHMYNRLLNISVELCDMARTLRLASRNFINMEND